MTDDVEKAEKHDLGSKKRGGGFDVSLAREVEIMETWLKKADWQVVIREEEWQF